MDTDDRVNLPPLPGTGQPRSKARSFVDVTAKLALVMAVLSVLYSVLQLALVGALGLADIGHWLSVRGLAPPAGLQWLLDHAVALGVLMLLFSLAFLAVSWGLLARHEWARLGFIAFLVLVAVANFACLPLIDAMFSGLADMFPAEIFDSVEGRELWAQLQISRWTSLITGGLTSLAFAVLHGWLVIRFKREDIREQFRR